MSTNIFDFSWFDLNAGVGSNRILIGTYTWRTRMTLSDLEWLSEMLKEMKHRAASLRWWGLTTHCNRSYRGQLSFSLLSAGALLLLLRISSAMTQTMTVDLLPAPCGRQRASSTTAAATVSAPSHVRSLPPSQTNSQRPPGCRPQSPETRSVICLEECHVKDIHATSLACRPSQISNREPHI